MNKLTPDQRRALAWGALFVTSLAGIVGCLLLLPAVDDFVAVAQLEGWKPAIFVWGFGACLLAWGFRLRPAPDDPARKISNIKAYKALLLTATCILVASTLYGLLSERVASALARRWPATVSTNAIAMKLYIDELDCTACVRSLDKLLLQDLAVERAELNDRTHQAVIWFDPAKRTESALLQNLTNHGYTPKKLP